MEGPDPRLVTLSLEPPYRDDNGKPIPNLRDIVQDGTLVFEEKQSASAALAPQLKRLHDLIISRKREFRAVTEARILADGAGIVDAGSSSGLLHSTGVDVDTAPDEDGNIDGPTQELTGEEQENQSSTLNPESLMQLRTDMIQRLEEAHHSMNTTLDMLNCLLAVNALSTDPTNSVGANPASGLAGLTSSTPAIQAPAAPLTLAPSILAIPTTKPSVTVMNAQIGITTRDAGIRKAAGILRRAALSAAEEIDRAGRGGGSGPSQGRYETSYWATALRLRQACWALLPAPLPPGAGPALKGSSRSAKDILFGFALEGSAVGYRRMAFGLIPPNNAPKTQITDDKPPLLFFPQSQNRRLRVSLRISGRKYSCPLEPLNEAGSLPGIRTGSVTQALNNLMRDAQQEIVEHEVFNEVMAQARYTGALVAQQSATVIELDITQDMALLFERVSTEDEEAGNEPSITDPSEPDVVVCTLIRQILTILLTRAHRGVLLDGMSASGAITAMNAATTLKKQVPILGPVISLLRYRAMIQRVGFEMKRVLLGLGRAGVQATLTLTGVSEPARTFVESLSRYVETLGDISFQPTLLQRPDQSLALSGEALLRIEDRHLIQVTFHSPTMLKLHVVQAQIMVHDHGQLGNFLRADVAARVVQYIQDTGRDFLVELTKSDVKGLEYSKSWFVDPIAGYCIGRWPNGKGRFQVTVQQDGSLHCESTVDTLGKPSTLVFDKTAQRTKLKDWVHSVMSLSPKPMS